MASVIEVSLLGPPRVERDGVLVAFDTRKALAVLALLALADRTCTRDRLADLLWPENDPTHARGALRRTLSTLRSAVGADRLETTSDHVRLVKGNGVTVDVDRFHDLTARGQMESAVELFRGDFLEGFAVRDAPGFENWVESEGDDLRRRFTGALAALTDRREAAGDRLGALESAQRWLAADGLHEPAHRALIRLYASVGDRAAALSQYRECVRTLGRELGVDPLTETTQLYESVLRGSYEVPPPDARPTKEEAPVPSPLVGRTGDLAVLRSQYDAIESDGRVALVEGEQGIGKTRLAVELLTRLHNGNTRVLAARAYEDEVRLAYAPIVEVIRGRLRNGTDWLAGLSEGSLREAARLVPELLSGRSPDPAPEIPQTVAEIRFLSGVWETILAAAHGPVTGALFIDDAQWADDATLRLLMYGLRRLTGRPLLVVLTWRAPHEHPIRNAVLAMVREGEGAAVRLERLDLAAVAELVRVAGGGIEHPADARRLWELSEGVPLLLVEYLRTAGTEDPGSLPTGVRDLLRGRLDQVSETARQVLAAAAVLGRSFDAGSVRIVSGRTEEETVSALEEVVRRGLVVERRFTYDFMHDLQRALVYEETGLARRRLLHGRAARLPEAPAGAAARHFQLAGRDAEAAEAFRTAGLLALHVFANGEALEHFRAALALGHHDRMALQVAIGDLQTVTGDYAGALLTLEAAASESGPDDLVAVEQRLGRLQYRRGEYAVAQAHFAAALSVLPDLGPAVSASVTADLSLAAHALRDLSSAQVLAHRARELAGDAGDDRALCQADNLIGMLATETGDRDGAVAVLGRCRDLADRLGDVDLRVAALNNLALAHREGHEWELAIQLTQEALELCRTSGDRHHEAALHNNLADLLHLSGRSEPAMVHLKSAVELLAEIGAQDEQPRAGIWKLVQW